MRRPFLCALLLGGFAALSGPASVLAGDPPAANAAPTVSSTPAASSSAPEIVISIDEQELRLVKGGLAVASFPISTSRFGVGDALHSYKTPLGMLEVCGKVGGDLPRGAVLKGCKFTGEVLPPNAPGRDPIVTRIIQLQGLEPQNRHALERGIYIHGTPEERRIGKPVSWGCIRMRSRDVVKLFEQVEVGTRVIICTKESKLAAPHEKGHSWWPLAWGRKTIAQGDPVKS